ncbi:DUF6247 family protein [Saccharothrix yanglingensis]|uniref:DUF6247 family protein n=1 Tax=Saccharothrix yanglingensis TaxID=659496 RepID=UPI003529371F
MSSPAARTPEPARRGPASSDSDELEPAPEWVRDDEAATRSGTPEAIRAGLLPEQAAEFDAAFDAALTAARRTLRPDQPRGTLQAWRRVALMTQDDPDSAREPAAAITGGPTYRCSSSGQCELGGPSIRTRAPIAFDGTPRPARGS